MKRMLAILPVLPLFLFAGCSSVPSLSGKTVNRMAGAFTAQVTVTTADSESRAILTRYGTESWSVCFTEPPALDGVQLDYLDSEVKASYKGLEFSVPQSAQALRTEIGELMTAVDSFASLTELDTHASDDLFVCEGELEVGSYTLAFAQDGTPVQFSLPAYGVVIGFEQFADDADAVTTESTTIPKTYPVTDAPTEESTEAAT